MVDLTTGKEVIAAIPTDLTALINWIGFGFQVIIGLAGVYLIFWLISMFVSHRKNKLLKKILKNLEEINSKLGKGFKNKQ